MLLVSGIRALSIHTTQMLVAVRLKVHHVVGMSLCSPTRMQHRVGLAGRNACEHRAHVEAWKTVWMIINSQSC